jgi:hypothetical protein
MTMPALLVRCTVPLGGGLLIPEAERDAFLATAPRAELVEVARNHYGVMDAPETAAAIAAFLA